LPDEEYPDYRLRISYPGDHVLEIDDPYRYGRVLSDYDLHLLGEGTPPTKESTDVYALSEQTRGVDSVLIQGATQRHITLAIVGMPVGGAVSTIPRHRHGSSYIRIIQESL